MILDPITLRIPGLSRTYTFLHTSDCHIAYAAPDDPPEAKEKAQKQTDAWSYTGLLPADALDEVLRLADHEKADGLFMCGDIADYCSSSNIDYIRERLKGVSTEIFYVCGNHERAGMEPEAAENRSFDPLYSDLMNGSPAFWMRDMGEFLIVGVDDGDKKLREEQLTLLKEQFSKNKPILLLLHIPIYTDAIVPPVKQKWGENGCDYFLLGQAHDTDLSRAFCDMIKQPDNPIAAIFAGHIHLSHAGEFSPGRMQFTSAPSFEGVIRKVILTGA